VRKQLQEILKAKKYTQMACRWCSNPICLLYRWCCRSSSRFVCSSTCSDVALSPREMHLGIDATFLKALSAYGDTNSSCSFDAVDQTAPRAANASNFTDIAWKISARTSCIILRLRSSIWCFFHALDKHRYINYTNYSLTYSSTVFFFFAQRFLLVFPVIHFSLLCTYVR